MASDVDFTAALRTRPIWGMNDVDFIGKEMFIPVKTTRGIETHRHPAPWMPEFKDWGFDEIYPEPAAALTPFEQVEAWDRERRRAGLKPWIEPRASGVAGLSNILKSHYIDDLRHQMNRQVFAGFWTGSHTQTTGERMLADMRRYSATVPHRRALTKLTNFKRGWRRQLAIRLAPELQEEW